MSSNSTAAPGKTSGFFKDSTLNVIQQMWAALLSIITSIIVARGLGVEDRGTYAVLVVVSILLVTFLNSGIEPAIVYLTAQRNTLLSDTVRGSVGLTFWVSLVGTGIMAVIVAFGGELFSLQFTPVLALLMIIMVPTLIYRNNMILVFRGVQDFWSYNLIEIIGQTAYLLFTAAMIVVFHTGIAGALLGIIFRNFLTVGLFFFFIRKHIAVRAILTLLPGRVFVRNAFSFGFRAYLNNIVIFLNYRIDVLLLGWLIGSNTIIGLYDLGVVLGEKIWILSKAASTVLFPRIAALEHDETARRNLTPRVARYIFWLTLAACIVTYFLADPVIQFVYGEEYALSAPGLKLLLPGLLALSVSQILSHDIAGRGKPEINAYQSLFAVLINIILNLILIPRLNFFGASIASSISYTALLLLTTSAFLRLSKTNWRELIVPTRADLYYMRQILRLIRARFVRQAGT